MTLSLFESFFALTPEPEFHCGFRQSLGDIAAVLASKTLRNAHCLSHARQNCLASDFHLLVW